MNIPFSSNNPTFFHRLFRPQVAFDLSALGEMPSISVDKEEATAAKVFGRFNPMIPNREFSVNPCSQQHIEQLYWSIFLEDLSFSIYFFEGCYIYTFMYIWYVHVDIHVDTHVQICTYIYTYIRIFTYTHIHIHVHVYIYIYIYIYICIYIYIYLYVSISIHIQCSDIIKTHSAVLARWTLVVWWWTSARRNRRQV